MVAKVRKRFDLVADSSAELERRIVSVLKALRAANAQVHSIIRREQRYGRSAAEIRYAFPARTAAEVAEAGSGPKPLGT
jgi:hypothetical protein